MISLAFSANLTCEGALQVEATEKISLEREIGLKITQVSLLILKQWAGTTGEISANFLATETNTEAVKN